MKKVILNQKSYLLYKEMVDFKKEFDKLKSDNYEFIIFPPILYLTLFKNVDYKVGTQNFYSYKTGSFSGELNLESLKDIGINYTMVGHYERRKLMYEPYEESKEKLFKSLSSKCDTILCLGASSKKRKPFSYIKNEINFYLKSIESNNLKYLSIAYIPNFAVGTYEYKVDKISKTIELIKKYVKNKYDINVEVYYGGYIDKENIKEIFDVSDGIIIDADSTNINDLKELLKEI